MRVLTFAAVAFLASTALATAQPSRGGAAQMTQGKGFGQTQMVQERTRTETRAQIRTQVQQQDESALNGWQAPDPLRIRTRDRQQLKFPLSTE